MEGAIELDLVAMLQLLQCLLVVVQCLSAKSEQYIWQIGFGLRLHLHEETDGM